MSRNNNATGLCCCEASFKHIWVLLSGVFLPRSQEQHKKSFISNVMPANQKHEQVNCPLSACIMFVLCVLD